MIIDIITLFPEMFKGPLTESMISRAQKRGIVDIKTHQLRKWAIDKRGTVDDRPYGGGPGMIMRVDVAYRALNDLSQKISNIQYPISNEIRNSKAKKLRAKKLKSYVILPTPSGKKFDQAMARRLAKKKHLVFLCPHYEGYDHRIELLVDEKVSIGDYVLTGGEIPAMAIVDAVVRLVPGVIKAESLVEESFSSVSVGRSSGVAKRSGGATSVEAVKYEHPQYTRPEVFEAIIKGNPSTSLRTRKIKKRVPKVLLSGNHALITKWRAKNAK